MMRDERENRREREKKGDYNVIQRNGDRHVVREYKNWFLNFIRDRKKEMTKSL